MPEPSRHSSSERKLAAIMFTDIVGYSALMGKDEDAAFKLLEQNRLLHKSIINEFNGKWLKEMGDGVLASFNTVSDAVNCALKIQESCSTDENISLRIGIHQGEVVFEDNDVFGDGVNIASRIESVTPGGGIYISESVFRNIENKKDIVTAFVGEKSLKNIGYPIKIYEVIVNFEGDAKKAQTTDQKARDNSIAVLPFVNMSADPEQEYFCEGLAEELLNILSQIDNLNVASRTSAFAFKGKNQDITLIGEKLRVRNILEGSVRKAGSRIRITVQLIDVDNGYHLWSEKYDRQMDDIFAIQDEIAQAIAERLNVTFGVDGGESVIKPSTENFQAYDSYLKGRYLIHHMDASVQDALELFQTAIDLDPNFAQAHAGIGDTLRAMGDQGMIRPIEVSEKANAALDHALDLNPKLADAYVTKAWINTFYDWDIIQAEKQYLMALQLDPNSDIAHSRYSTLLSWMLYRNDDAISEAQKAVEISPTDTFTHYWLGLAFCFAHRFQDAINQLQHAIMLDSNSFLNHYALGLVLRLNNQIPEAITAQKTALEISGPHPWALAELGLCYTDSDELEEAENCFNQMLKIHEIAACGVHLSFLCGALGNIDQAFDYLEEAYQSREPWVPIVQRWHSSNPLRSDPRFEDFVRRVGVLPPEMKGNDNL